MRASGRCPWLLRARPKWLGHVLKLLLNVVKNGNILSNGDVNSKIICKMVPNNRPTVWGRYLPPIDFWGWSAFGLTTLEKTMMD
jgi:hypothetical protein